MKINMTSKDGVTLLTKGKYCTEDIEVTPTFETGGGGSDIVVEVNELPTENIDESKIYVVNKVSDIEVYYCYGSGYMTLAEAVASSIGAAPTIYYEVVSELPASPTATDLQAFNPIYCYIYNNVAYVYGNAGSGDMWLTVSALFSQMGQAVEDKGRTYDIMGETEGGLYTFWADKIIGKPILESGYSLRNSKWISSDRYINLYLKRVEEITEDDCIGFDRVPPSFQEENRLLKKVTLLNGLKLISRYAFNYCENLTSIDIPDSITSIEEGAFGSCGSLQSIKMPAKLETIYNAFSFTNILLYDFRRAEQVPTISLYALSELSTESKIVVPDSLYDSWIIAEHWDYYASYIVKASEYTE